MPIKIAVIGASGYTGLELLRILASHPEAEVVRAASRQYAGKDVAGVFPALAGRYGSLKFTEPTDLSEVKADVAFSALPHGASQAAVPELLKSCAKVIDLSADFRIRDAAVYSEWYGEHKSAGLLKKAVYGLPELKRPEIKKATLVANPGCYPTGAILALSPLLKKGLMDSACPVIDSKSGASGAGRSASVEMSFCEVAGAFKAYKVGCHRHTPEIEQELSEVSGSAVSVSFTPHLLPVSRGILTTAYAGLREAIKTSELLEVYREFYRDEFFVRVMPEGMFPDISQVRASNFCDIGVWADEKRRRAIVVSAIDNLVKGASGQAVQNMNIISGLDETTALAALPVSV